MFTTRLAFFLTAFLFAFASARQTRHHMRRGNWVSVVNPNVTLQTCQMYTIRWNGTGSPYSVGVLVGTSPSAPLYHLGNPTSNIYPWNVDLPPNTTITIAVKAQDGSVGYSEKIVIMGSPSTGCLASSPWKVPGYTYPSSANATASINGTSNGNSTTSSINGTSTSIPGVSSGIGGAAAAATQSKASSATRVTAGLSLLLGCAIFALAA